MGGSVNEIVGLLVLAGLFFTVIVWWQKRDLFLSGVVFAFFALLTAGIVFTWPTASEIDVEAQRKRAEIRLKQQQEQVAVARRQAAEAAKHDEEVLGSLVTWQKYRPAEKPANGYVASGACRECHVHNHETWHASYHRTMTQVATPEAVFGNFDNLSVTAKGREYQLSRVGEVCLVVMNDPDLPPSPETKMEVPILMATGSHHMQIYWYPARMPRTMGQLPIAYLKETQQWVPRSAIFLEPPDGPVSTEMGRWNSGCSRCHSTHARERLLSEATYDTEVSELGISCEACHGPGEQHIAMHRRSTRDPDTVDPIVNPASLSHRASAQVCGQCHSSTITKEDGAVVSEHGHGYRPGDDLDETHHVWDSERIREYIRTMNLKMDEEQTLRQIFWDDGNVRVSGREFNGLIVSPCYQHGEMSCLSCHCMHQDESDSRSRKTWANDQLSLIGLDDQACTQCHEASNYGTQHTHHAADSSGARCYNCHMPNTSYGLLTAMRSHTITSPDVGRDLKARRPNACNLCHLDKTLEWTAVTMSEWYESEIPDLSDEQKSIAASVIWLLKGDAGQRALAAWHMGWQDAQGASGTDWIAPLLAQLMVDPYEAVRIITRRSVRSLPTFEDLEFDAVGEEAERRRVMTDVLKTWLTAHAPDNRLGEEILIDESGIQADRVKVLMKKRDDTLIRLME